MAALLCVMFATPAAAQKSGCEDDLIARVQSAYQSMKSFQGQFEQIDRQLEGDTTNATGDIAYSKPGKMRWNYHPPHEQTVVTDGATVWLYDPLLDNVTLQPLTDLTQGTPLSFLLGVGNLAEDFECRPITRPPPDSSLTYLELVPRNPIPTLAFIQMGVRPSDAGLEILLIVDTQNNVRQVTLLDLKKNVGFPENHFTFEITDEMEVITK